MNSIESMTFSGCKSCRKIHTLQDILRMKEFFFRVADLLMSRHGKMRFSISFRSKWISELPVP